MADQQTRGERFISPKASEVSVYHSGEGLVKQDTAHHGGVWRKQRECKWDHDIASIPQGTYLLQLDPTPTRRTANIQP